MSGRNDHSGTDDAVDRETNRDDKLPDTVPVGDPIGVLPLSKEKQLMKRTILFLLISCLTLLCAVFVDTENGVVRAFTYVGGLLFWIFLLLGYIMFYRFSKYRKSQQKNNRSVNQDHKPGIIVFFSNPAAKKADIVMILSLIISVVMVLIKQGIKGSDPTFNSLLYEFVSVLSFALFLFTAQMHAILNGVNYRYYLSLTGKHRRNQPTEDRDDRKTSERAVSEGDTELK